jgi:hypothetical protein
MARAWPSDLVRPERSGAVEPFLHLVVRAVRVEAFGG